YVRGGEAPAPEGEALEILKGEQVPAVLDLLEEKVKAQEELTVATVKPLFRQITKELKIGGKQVFMPIRIALTGEMQGPELYDLIPLLGLENVISRLAKSRTYLNS
ncbi:MAG: glutamate--tRNA ligase, partial [Desulfitobacterium sp.]|nr:glutamate--tRNA ligase [Desulfitobacterium sp.]